MNLQLFKFKQSDVRVKLIDNEPWFLAKDVCNVLEIVNISDACSKLRDKDKLVSVEPISGQNRDVLFVSEAGLYDLVFSSRKPQAKEFKYWVFEEVLPSIRKTGKYEVKQEKKAEYNPNQISPALKGARECREIMDLLEHENPRLAQVLIDSCVNHHIGNQPILDGATIQYKGVVEIAQEMGFKVDLSLRTKLGKEIAKQKFSSKKEKRLCNGMIRDINCYQDVPELREAIKNFFTQF